ALQPVLPTTAYSLEDLTQFQMTFCDPLLKQAAPTTSGRVRIANKRDKTDWISLWINQVCQIFRWRIYSDHCSAISKN
ncbi:MAG: hypothetical protein AAFO63_09760, partial [Pseudomonadota bacterium]